MKDLLIGCDIGTSSLKLVLMDFLTKEIVLNSTKSIVSSNIFDKDSLNYSEQNVDKIVEFASEIFKIIPLEYHQRIMAFQLCGQVIILNLSLC